MMFDFIKYFPMELRWDGGPCDPRGPDFESARDIRLLFEGSTVEFKAPGHSPQYRDEKEKKPPKSNLKEVAVMRPFNSGAILNNWKQSVCFKREWAFWGPWFSGSRAEVTMYIRLVCRSEGCGYSGSFFNTKMFESVIVDYLNDSYGHKSGPNNLPGYVGPIHWKARNIGVFCADFEIQQMNIDTPQGEPVRRMIFPIADDYLVDVTLNPSVPINTLENGQRLIKPDRIYELRDSIMESFKVTLSNDTRSHYAKVNQNENPQFVSSFAPLKWPISSDQPEGSTSQPRLAEDDKP